MISLNESFFKSPTQKNYTDAVNQKMSEDVPCTKPGCPGHYVRHGTYSRYFLYEGKRISVDIQQVYCPVCHKSHALLCFDMVPYSHIPAPIHIEVAKAYEEALEKLEEEQKASESGGNPAAIKEKEVLEKADARIIEIADTEKVPDLSYLYAIAKCYGRRWKAMLSLHGVTLDNPGITRICLTEMHAQVMQPRLKYANYLVGTWGP